MPSHPQVLSSEILFLGIIPGKLCAWPYECNIGDRWDRVIAVVGLLGHLGSWVFPAPIAHLCCHFYNLLATASLLWLLPCMRDPRPMAITASSIWQEGDSQLRETDESVNADESFKSPMHHSREGKGGN